MFARVRTIASRPGTVRVTIEAAMVMAHARKSRRVSVVGVNAICRAGDGRVVPEADFRVRSRKLSPTSPPLHDPDSLEDMFTD